MRLSYGGRVGEWAGTASTRVDQTLFAECHEADRLAAARCQREIERVRAGHASFLDRSEEHTSELQSLMRISYAVFCLKKKKKQNTTKTQDTTTQIYQTLTTPHSNTCKEHKLPYNEH